MAGFLFVDGVGFQKLNEDIRHRVVASLYKKCAEELERIKARSAGGVGIDGVETGDGVIVCAHDASGEVNPGLILLDLAFELQELARPLGTELGVPNGVHFRMGIHHGAHFPLAGMNQRPNFGGSAVFAGQRVMSCGEEDHILCSSDARAAFFQQMPESYGEVEFAELPGPYSDKHGARVLIANVIRLRQGRVINGNPKPPAVRLNPDMRLFPSAKAIAEFRGVKHLVVVGVTNDQIARMLGVALGASGESKLREPHTIQRLDVYFATDRVYEKLPAYEHSLRYRGAVDGNSRRDLVTCKAEKGASIEILKRLCCDSDPIHVRLMEYPFPPAAAIVARDVADPRRGIIEVTHYIWGWKLGSCPTVTWPAHPASQGYDLYREYLELLEKDSKVLYDSERGC
jgi:hypothetical protein